MGLVGQPYLAEESHRASVHSTKPTTDCRRYHVIILLNHLVQHVPLLMVLVFLPCPATQMFTNFHFSPGQLLNETLCLPASDQNQLSTLFTMDFIVNSVLP